MYDRIGEDLKYTYVTDSLDIPLWIDKAGKKVDKYDAFGCKVTHNITWLDMCLVVDEVDGNTNQKGVGNVRGELHLHESGKTSQQQINTKRKTLRIT